MEIALVVCRNPKNGKWLAINDAKGQGWGFIAGLVDPPENFFDAGLREAKEEAGIDIEIKGILRFEYNEREPNVSTHKMIMYAEPKDPDQELKQEADNNSGKPLEETEEARWLSIDELLKLKYGKPGWRGNGLYDWIRYIEKGGQIYPTSLFVPEGTPVKEEKSSSN